MWPCSVATVPRWSTVPMPAASIAHAILEHSGALHGERVPATTYALSNPFHLIRDRSLQERKKVPSPRRISAKAGGGLRNHFLLPESPLCWVRERRRPGMSSVRRSACRHPQTKGKRGLPLMNILEVPLRPSLPPTLQRTMCTFRPDRRFSRLLPVRRDGFPRHQD